MKRFKWPLLYALTFILAFALSIYVTISRPSGIGDFNNVTWNDTVGKVYTDLPYADGELNKFDLYVPADRSRNSYKLVLYIHAGGFTGGDKAEDATWGRYLTSKGYVTATINYTTSSEARPSSVYRMSREIQQGVVAIKNAAGKLGYKLDEMVVAGGSAGGALAMIYAYRDAAASPIPVKCVIQMVGPGSFDPADWFGLDRNYKADDQAAAAAAFVSAMTGDKVSPGMMRSGEYKASLAKISPHLLVTDSAVPSLIAYGPHDKLVPFATAKALIMALKEHGVPYDYIEFSNSGHGLNRDPDKAELLFEMFDAYLKKYLPVSG